MAGKLGFPAGLTQQHLCVADTASCVDDLNGNLLPTANEAHIGQQIDLRHLPFMEKNQSGHSGKQQNKGNQIKNNRSLRTTAPDSSQ